MKEEKEDYYINLALENLERIKILQDTVNELIQADDKLKKVLLKLLKAIFEGKFLVIDQDVKGTMQADI